MSLRANIVANYISQIYTSAIAILMLPLYLKHMGAEAYGLVGFYAMLQAWFQMLDVGLSPTLSRQTALYRGGGVTGSELRNIVRALELFFATIGVLGSTGLVLASEYVSTHWLKVQSLPHEQVRTAVVLMALILPLRWISGLYRSAISGLERQVWLSGLNTLVATLRFVAVIPVLLFLGSSCIDFFSYQLGIAVFELAILFGKFYSTAPELLSGPIAFRTLSPPSDVLKFAISIAFTSIVWVVVTQTDKLLLSRLLQLSDYGYFTLAVLVAGGITMISGPLSTAIVPRMTRMHAEGDEKGMIALYQRATQLTVIVTLPPCLILAMFPYYVLWAWTGDPVAAERTSSVLMLYSLGNGILVLAAFQHFLQFAHGNLKLHVIGNALFISILLPLLCFAVERHGMQGAGWVWFLSNLFWFIAWVPLVHRTFAPRLHWTWLFKDIFPSLSVISIVAVLLRWHVRIPDDRTSAIIALFALGLLLLIVGGIGSSWARNYLKSSFRRE